MLTIFCYIDPRPIQFDKRSSELSRRLSVNSSARWRHAELVEA